MIPILRTNLNTFAFSVAYWPGGAIVLGRHARYLAPTEVQAVLLHEEGHLVHRHALRRVWWVLSFQWRDLADRCRRQELEADRYAIDRGAALGLHKFLARFPASHKNALHPTPGERIAHIYETLRGISHGE